MSHPSAIAILVSATAIGLAASACSSPSVPGGIPQPSLEAAESPSIPRTSTLSPGMATLVAKWATEDAAPTLMPAKPSATLSPTIDVTETGTITLTVCPLTDEARQQESAAVYQSAFSHANQPVRDLLISDRPALREQDIQWLSEQAHEDLLFLEPYLNRITSDTIAGFIAGNTPPPNVSPTAFTFPHRVLSSAEIDQLLGGDPVSGWSRFEARYPNSMGYWAVSQVGFDCNLSQALVFLRHVYGYAGMTGTFYLLHKEKGAWEVTDEFLFSEA